MNVTKRAVRFLAIALLSSLLVTGTAAGAIAQLFNLPSPPPDTAPQPQLQIQRQGNIEYAYVSLDGKPLFPVAAPVREAATEPAVGSDRSEPEMLSEGIPSIQRRVEQVENNLALVLARGGDPQELRVVAGQINNQSVIFAADRQGLRSLQIVTLTDLDVKLSGLSESELVLNWVTTLRSALTQALRERQPDFLRQQGIQAAQILGVVMLISLGVALVQRSLKRRWNHLNQLPPELSAKMAADMAADMAGKDDVRADVHEMATLKPLQLLALHLPQMTRARQQNINVLFRRLLQWVQVALWLGAMIWSLTLFPQTREVGQWLARVPVRLLMILLVMGFANKLAEVLIDYFLQVWAEQESINPNGAHRQACRAPTFSVALKGFAMLVVLVVGVIWALYELRVPIAPILTGAGILGVALSLSAQNLIKDMINGSFILLEDQYAVGDVIAVGDVLGFVEHISLRITQLRTPDGELVTIPNGAIATVRNLSNGWSRVNFEIEVSYDTDADKAMQIMEAVAEGMRQEPEWGDRILEPAQILGVDKLAHTGILIRVWIKTRPLQQWNVSREYRRRLKRAFEEHHIPIGVPQQFLRVKNADALTLMEETVIEEKERSPSPPS
ncbi:MAG: mechanosensitive ion channel family protein [Synechococcales bacterium]|nr:mechanosensitive ion channel family protein [Synechococcales bacterium]